MFFRPVLKTQGNRKHSPKLFLRNTVISLGRYSDEKRTATPIEANIMEAIRAEITARMGICADKADPDNG